MSAPIIWVIIPLLFAGILFFLSRWENIVYFIGVAFTSWLAWVAWIFPVNQILDIGEKSIKLGDSFTILGRSLIITEVDKPLILFLYAFAALWLIGGWILKPNKYFVSYILSMVALFLAALTVKPFLFAALIIEVIVLISVSQFLSSQEKVGKGVIRFLSLYTLGMPFILLTGWMLVGAEVSPENLDIVLRTGVLLGLGFSFLLFIIPFHSWIPMLSEDAHPFVFAFLLFILPGAEIMFGLGFINQLSWLRNSNELILFLQYMGALMILMGGLWGFTENNISRVFAYLVVFEMGWTFLIFSVGEFANVQLFFYSWFLKGIFYWIFGIAFTRIKKFNWGDMSFNSLQGMAKQLPVESLAILLSHFSLTGIPLFAGFPVFIDIISQINTISTSLMVIILFGVFAMMGAGLRILVTLFLENEEVEIEGDAKFVNPFIGFVFQYTSDPSLASKWFFTSCLLLVVFVLGLFPNIFMKLFDNFSMLYNQFGQ
jgi:NADH-quinone oxidoreductase subunit N